MVTKRRRNILIGVSAVALCAIAGFAGYVFFFYTLYQNMRTARSPEERRAAAHRVLYWETYEHDAFVYLCEDGSEESVPYLIAAIRHLPDASEGRLCMWEHCIAALEKTTGQKFGDDKEAWLQWYNDGLR